MKFIIIILLLGAAFLSIRYLMPTLGTAAIAGITAINGESFLADCPDTPNCQCSEASRQSQKVERFTVDKDPGQSIESLARIVENVPGMAVVRFDENYLYATATSPIMQYVDDIEFLLSNDKQSIQVRSASRIGKNDLGANAERIDALREATSGKL
ncbi:MAG: hypothetical protein ACI9XK_002409 [Granulosicoccus sp.]|jgi:uncharacterized protein (DUF1499 family)